MNAQEIITRIARAEHDYQMFYGKPSTHVVISYPNCVTLRLASTNELLTTDERYPPTIRGMRVCHTDDDTFIGVC